jgi:tetratricopeptide (TPR) repeat protein
MKICRFLILSFCFLCLPAGAQGPPGCYTPRFSGADEQIREQSVQNAENQYGAASIQVADALITLADVYQDTQPEKARIALTRALKIREQKFGSQSDEVAATKLLIAECYEMQSQYASAESILKEALATREKLFGKSDRRLIPVIYDLANCYVSPTANRAGDALPLIARAQTISDTVYGSKSAHTYQLVTMRACAYRSLGKHQIAQQTEGQAQIILSELNSPYVGAGTARHLNLEPILAAEDAKAALK